MCRWGTDRFVKLCKPTAQGKYWVAVDSCIADLVRALNDANIETIGCCCGHGKENGSILLADGRELKIKGEFMTNKEEAELWEAMHEAVSCGKWPVIHIEPEKVFELLNTKAALQKRIAASILLTKEQGRKIYSDAVPDEVIAEIDRQLAEMEAEK